MRSKKLAKQILACTNWTGLNMAALINDKRIGTLVEVKQWVNHYNPPMTLREYKRNDEAAAIICAQSKISTT